MAEEVKAHKFQSKYTLSNLRQRASSMTRSEFRGTWEYKAHLKKGTADIALSYIPYKKKQWDYDLALACAIQCTYISEFTIRFRSAYSFCVRNNLLKLIVKQSGLRRAYKSSTYEDCLKYARMCQSNTEFNTKYHALYKKAQRKKWLDAIRIEMKWPLKNN